VGVAEILISRCFLKERFARLNQFSPYISFSKGRHLATGGVVHPCMCPEEHLKHTLIDFTPSRGAWAYFHMPIS
jgi:hypothetical protein